MTSKQLSEIRTLLAEIRAIHKTPAIWKYGELEFHFGPRSNDGLALLYSETEDGVVDVSIPKR